MGAVRFLPRPPVVVTTSPIDPQGSGSYRVHGNSLGSNLASQVVGLVTLRIEYCIYKRAAVGCAAWRQGYRFNDANFAEQRSCCGVVIQGKVVELVCEGPGFLPHARHWLYPKSSWAPSGMDGLWVVLPMEIN
jgi:hypothetical protein